LANVEGIDVKSFNEMVSFQSRLLGISETSSDMRDLLEHETKDVRAAEAVALFCHQIGKCVGSFAAALGGLETLVFSGGIGENSATIRARICAGLGFLGIELNKSRNAELAGVISADSSRVTVRFIRTDEEQMIAKTGAAFSAFPHQGLEICRRTRHLKSHTLTRNHLQHRRSDLDGWLRANR